MKNFQYQQVLNLICADFEDYTGMYENMYVYIYINIFKYMAYYSDLFVSVCVQIFCPPVYLPDDGLPPQVVALSRQCSGPQSTVTKPRKTQPAVHRGKHLPAQRE